MWGGISWCPADILSTQIDKYTYTFDPVAFTKASVAASYRRWRLILIGGPDDLERERVIWAQREEDVRRYAEEERVERVPLENAVRVWDDNERYAEIGGKRYDEGPLYRLVGGTRGSQQIIIVLPKEDGAYGSVNGVKVAP